MWTGNVIVDPRQVGKNSLVPAARFQLVPIPPPNGLSQACCESQGGLVMDTKLAVPPLPSQ